jgi:hypothetical protein
MAAFKVLSLLSYNFNFFQSIFFMKLLTFIVVLFLAIPAFAQTSLLSENFDTTPTTTVPNGWSSVPIGWNVDSSNFSIGYNAASGMKNIVIRNTTATGVYQLVTPSFSTVGFSYVGVNWAARNSTNFETSGSNIGLLEYSIDNGISWTPVYFVQNVANSVWGIVNNGLTIPLPSAAAGLTAVKLRLTANIFNALQGTYRIDDFSVLGNNTPFATTVSELKSDKLELICFPNPSTSVLNIQGEDFIGSSIQVVDLFGKEVKIKFQSASNNNLQLNTSELVSGLYFINIITTKGKIFSSTFSKIN